MVQIIPAILAKTEEEYSSDLSRVQDSGLFEGGWVQIDFMDNKFVPSLSITPEIVSKYPLKLDAEAHLMVEDPNSWVKSLSEIGIKRVIAHVELGKEIIDDFVATCQVAKLEVGLAINNETPIAKLEPYWDTIDLVLVMSVEPGEQGRLFISDSLEKVKEIFNLRKEKNLNFRIEVDGGINKQVVPDLVKMGADNLVIGSHLLEGDIDENIEQIWEAIKF